jgi:hypothetical protein
MELSCSLFFSLSQRLSHLNPDLMNFDVVGLTHSKG